MGWWAGGRRSEKMIRGEVLEEVRAEGMNNMYCLSLLINTMFGFIQKNDNTSQHQRARHLTWAVYSSK